MRSTAPQSSVARGASAARVSALVLILAGAAIMLAAVFADALGIGGGKGFGWKQMIAAIAGLVLVLGGVAWLLQPAVGRDPADDPLEPLD